MRKLNNILILRIYVAHEHVITQCICAYILKMRFEALLRIYFSKLGIICYVTLLFYYVTILRYVIILRYCVTLLRYVLVAYAFVLMRASKRLA